MTRIDNLNKSIEGFKRKVESGEITYKQFIESLKATSFCMIAACFCEYMDKKYPYRRDKGE